MSKIEIDEAKIFNAIDMAFLSSVEALEEKIIDITPRDPKRPPKDPTQKVTGNLQQSIWNEKIWDWVYLVGVESWVDAERYAGTQEFWYENIPARSYLWKWLEDNSKELINNFIRDMEKRL